MNDEQRGRPEVVLDVVVELLESDGYDGWSLADVARRAHVSLRDIYKHFPTRSELIVAAFSRWMENNTYADITPPEDASLPEGLVWCFRRLLEPWVDHPRLIAAYQRVLLDPSSRDLETRGLATFRPAIRTVLRGVDRAYAEDLSQTLGDVLLGLTVRVVRGEMPMTDVLPSLERTIHRLTSDNHALAQRGKQHVAQRTKQRVAN